MKDLNTISMEELETIAKDESVKVPESFDAEVKATMDMLSFMDGLDLHEEKAHKVKQINSPWIVRTISVAASVALLISLGYGVSSYMNSPKDTYTDPYQAYAELEQALNLISSKVEKGAKIAQGAEAVMDKTNQIIANIQ